MPYVGKHGAAVLRNYKYQGDDLSYMTKYVFQPFWRRFVLLFPLWVAPNTVTLVGFMFVITSCIIAFVYSPTLVTPSPRWVYVAHGLLLFLYQTFDSVDGKQARRTNSSSPLGELFDHGCDALACAFEALAFGSVVLAGKTVFWQWVFATLPFYFATWETFYTHTLLLQVVNGPTEGLMMIYLAEIFTAFIGGEWWTLDFRTALGAPGILSFIPHMPLNQFVLWMLLIPGVIPTILFSNVANVHKVLAKGNRGTKLQAYSMLLPYAALIGGLYLWTQISPSDVLGTRPFLLISGSAFAFGLLVDQMILAHLCDEEKGLKTKLWKALGYLPLPLGNAYAARWFDGVPPVDELWVLIGYCIYTGGLYMHFAHGVIYDICNALNIYAFRIGKPHDVSVNAPYISKPKEKAIKSQ